MGGSGAVSGVVCPASFGWQGAAKVSSNAGRARRHRVVSGWCICYACHVRTRELICLLKPLSNSLYDVRTELDVHELCCLNGRKRLIVNVIVSCPYASRSNVLSASNCRTFADIVKMHHDDARHLVRSARMHSCSSYPLYAFCTAR
jgi:hypothetical protein